MNLDGSGVTRLTDRVGYDGGAFFSPDGSRIVWRAHYPGEGQEKDDYQSLLARGLIHPSGEKIIWSSNHLDPQGREFDLFMSNVDGTGLEQITFSEGFDGFPVFSPDGRFLAFGSNRNNGDTRDTNVFIAEWVDAPGM